ncbi:MAG: AIR synthase related protein [Promethearchaeati archaeon SRVP18_Atabeyarchaeia-1]
MSVDLKSTAASLRAFAGATRKLPIIEITRKMRETALSITPPGARIIESFGEDCAVIDIGDEGRLILFKAEEMWHDLVKADPKFAGYCSILAAVNDVSAKGGEPIAIVDTIASASPAVRDKIVEGIVSGCMKFNVPIVGGHLNPDAPFDALSVAILGIVQKNSLLRSDAASPGDLIVVAIDLDGHFHNMFKYAWDTTSHKSKTEVANCLSAIREIASSGVSTSAKDISNPGVVGTLGMLLHSSKAGGVINLGEIPMPQGIDSDRWLKAYPGFGVVLTVRAENKDSCLSVFHRHGVEARAVGKVNDSGRLLITDGKVSAEVFDFRKDRLSGKP